MPKHYIVQTNDTLYKIVSTECPDSPLEQTVRQVVKDNRLDNANLIYVGQLLVLNCAQDNGGQYEAFTHIVKQGETLIGIAKTYRKQCPNITWKTIAEDNNIYSPYIIYPGQQLTIECSGDGIPLNETVLDVPYYSQNDADSDTSSTDCGPTCVRMLIGWDRIRQGKQDNRKSPTIDDMWAKTGKKSGEMITVSELITLAGYEEYKLKMKLKDPPSATIKWIVSEIEDGYPVIMLCHYGTINPPGASWTKGHYVVVIGFNDTHIYFHDPNCWASSYRIVERSTFDKAIGLDNALDGNAKYQGLYVER